MSSLYEVPEFLNRMTDPFELDPTHPLNDGCVFAMLGRMPGFGFAYDSSFFSNHGTLSSNMDPATAWVWSPELNRYELEFDGLDDYGTIPSTFIYRENSPITFSAWIVTRTGIYAPDIATYGTASYVPRIGLNAAAKLLMSFGGYEVWGTAVLAVDTLYHVVASWSQADGVKFYINGGSDPISAGSGPPSSNTTTTVLEIGRQFGRVGEYYRMRGVISDLIIYHRVLCPGEISILANRADPTYDGWIQSLRGWVPGISVGGDVTISPALLTANAVLNDPVVRTDVTITPVLLTANAVLNAPTVATAVTSSPLVLTANAVLNAPTVKIDVTASPVVLTANAVLNAPIVKVDCTVSPAVLTASAVLNAPTIKADCTVSPAVLTASAILNAPVITIVEGVSFSSSVLTANAILNAPTVKIDCTITPAVLTAVVVLNASTVVTAVSVSPTVLTANAILNASTVKVDCTVTPSILVANAVLLSPTIIVPSDVTVTVSVLTAIAVLNMPSVFTALYPYEIDLCWRLTNEQLHWRVTNEKLHYRTEITT